MNINYNQVALRQLRPTLLDILGRINTAARDTAHPVAPALVEEASQMRPGLEMVGCSAVAALAGTLSDAVVGLSNPARRGWEGENLVKIATATATLASSMPRLLEDLAEGRPTQPVSLYAAWRDLLAAMRAEVPPPESLFQPDPDFEDQKFVRMDPEYLRDIVQAASARLAALLPDIEAVAGDATPPSLATGKPGEALRTAAEIVDWVYRLHHRRGFQAFWLTARALLEALLQAAQPPSLAPAQVLALLRDVHIEMERLAADSRQVSSGVLMTWAAPLLLPWPDAWSSAPWLGEFRQRMHLDAFWHALEGLSSPPSSADPAATLAVLSQAWSQWLDGSGSPRRVARALSDWLAMAPREAALGKLVAAMSKVASWCLATPPGDAPDETAVTEIATAIVLQEDVLAWGLTAAAAARLDVQAARLDALMVPGRPGLASLPAPRWDNARAARDSRHARALAAAEMAKDLATLEERLSDIHRGDIAVADIRTELSGLLPSMEVGASVLSMLRLPAASAVAADILSRVDRLAGHAAVPSQQAIDDLSLEMTALSDFLHALVEGAVNPVELLHPALALVPPDVAAAMAQDGAGSASQTKPTQAAPAVPATAVSAPLAAPAAPPPAAHKPPVVTSQEWVARLSQPDGFMEDSRAGQDEEIVESFLEEARLLLAEITATRRDLAASPSDPELIETLRRFFHTIKGAARLAGLPAAGEVAWWGERVAANWADRPDADAAAGKVAALLGEALRQYRTDGTARIEAVETWAAVVSFVNPSAATPAPAEPPIENSVPEAEEPVQPPAAAAEPEPAPVPAEPAIAPEAPPMIPESDTQTQAAAPPTFIEPPSGNGMDEEYRAALQEDWRTQDSLLAKAAASGDAAALRAAAHTLRSLASLLGWSGWAEECAGVERAILASEQVDVEVWASRWRDAIAEAVDGEVPSPEARARLRTESAAAQAVGHGLPDQDTQPVAASGHDHAPAPIVAQPLPEEDRPQSADSALAAAAEAEGEEATSEVEVEVEAEDAPAAAAPASPPALEGEPSEAATTAADAAPARTLIEMEAETAAEPVVETKADTDTDAEAEAETEGSQPATPALPEDPLPGPTAAPDVAPEQASPLHPHPRSADWDEVFAAFDAMLEACNRIGAALERLADQPDPADAGSDGAAQ